MSMLLDLGLFLRENNLYKINKKTGEREKITITSSIRGFLFTLACRIGSDPYTWVSQEVLAEELDMTVDNLKRLSKKAGVTCLIETEKNPKDKRKNVYRPANFLINYTQKRRENLSTIDGYGMIWEPKKGAKRPPNKSRKGAKRPPTRGQKGHLFSSKKQEKNDINHNDTTNTPTPEGHTTTIKSKQPGLDFKFYPNLENQKLADQLGSELGKTGAYLVQKFIDKIMRPYGIKNDLDKRFRKFLLSELPAKNKSPNTKETSVSYFDRDTRSEELKNFSPSKPNYSITKNIINKINEEEDNKNNLKALEVLAKKLNKPLNHNVN